MKVKGGVLTIITAYAPHSGYKHAQRKMFFDGLESMWKPSRDHDCTVVLGDSNAKLYQQFASDNDVLGDYALASPLPKKGIALSNRELLLKSCKTMGSVVANTFFEHDVDHLATYYGTGASPNEVISVAGFSQIDHCLVHKDTLGKKLMCGQIELHACKVDISL